MSKTPTTKPKEPRTIEVKSLLIGIGLVLAFALGFGVGWTEKIKDQTRVNSEASALVEQLKSTN